METIRFKRLVIATDTGQLRRLTLQLDANEIHHAIGSQRRWKAATGAPWLMVPTADLSRAIAPIPALATGTSLALCSTGSPITSTPWRGVATVGR
jgi:hypothetical protein